MQSKVWKIFKTNNINVISCNEQPSLLHVKTISKTNHPISYKYDFLKNTISIQILNNWIKETVSNLMGKQLSK